MIIIGEKLNGTIPSVAEAIAARDEQFIKDRAIQQAAAGADFIDVCASVAPDVEVETLKWMIDLVQSVVDTPICIDSPNPEACVAAIPFCNKEGLVNSVSMEGNKVEVVFPVIAKTGWQCVALLCDNTGIPQTAEKRLAIFKDLMAEAEKYGIAPSRLHIDPLVTTLATEGSSLATFSACAAEIRKAYPDIHITSGLSNISFGLPNRKSINQAFMVLAMNAGMDSAIADPLNRDMLGIMYAADALLENDEYCLEYIHAFREGRIGPVKK